MTFWRDQRGNMSILFAAALSLAGVVGAISVDSAALFRETRMVQAAVDLAAITATADPDNAESLARTVLRDAGFVADPVVEIGHYGADPAKSPEMRFVRGRGPVNAVRVSYRQTGTLYFGANLMNPPEIAATGTAMVVPEVSFSIGSRLASFNGGLANAVLGTLLGTTVNFSLADYTALADARVETIGFLDGLAGSLGITAGTYDALLTHEVRAGTLVGALAKGVSGPARLALETLSRASAGSPVPLKKLLTLGRYGRMSVNGGGKGLGAQISALEILSAAAALADGQRQVWLGLGGSIPGVAALSLDLAVGEPAGGGGWFGIGPAGTVVRTAQVRLRIDAQIAGNLTLQNALIRLPLWLDLASSEAKVVSATCPNRAEPNGTAEIAVLPGVAILAVGKPSNAEMRDFGTPLPLAPVRILDATLLQVSASGHLSIAQTSPVPLAFSSADIGVARLKMAKVTTPVTSLAQGLVSSLNFDISILGLGLSLPSVINTALKTVVAPLGPPLDAILNSVLTTLGLGIGEADVRVYGVRCATPVLVG